MKFTFLHITLIIVMPFLLLTACSGPTPTVVSDGTGDMSVESVTETSAQTATPWSILYYFHRTLRCQECLSMELFTGALVESEFEGPRLDGRFEYEVINLDEPQQAHFANEFNLTFSSLVLADIDNDGVVIRWKELEEAWEKSLDQAAFKGYVTEEINHWLEAQP